MINPELKEKLDTAYDLLESCEARFEKAQSARSAQFVIDLCERIKSLNEEAAEEHLRLAQEADTEADRAHHQTHYFGYNEMALQFDSAASYYQVQAAALEFEEAEQIANEVEDAAEVAASVKDKAKSIPHEQGAVSHLNGVDDLVVAESTEEEEPKEPKEDKEKEGSKEAKEPKEKEEEGKQ